MNKKKSGKIVGILGLQGAYQKHIDMLDQLSVKTLLIRYPEEIDKCDAIIFPGGESTTMSKLIDNMGLREKLKNFSGPKFGTCAGAILLSEYCDDERVNTLANVPINTKRNAYGRQIESFVTEIQLSNEHNHTPFPAVFIRAPELIITNNDVEVLAEYKKKSVLVKYKNILLSSFHPELTNDIRIHKLFINLIELE